MVRISNFKIIKLLEKNSRMPYIKIAEKLGVTETAVRKRVRKMEDAGVIRGYNVDIDPKKLGYEVDALIGLDAKPDYYMEVVEELKKMKEIRGLYSSSGDHMFMIECWFRNSKELRAFAKKLKSIKGVTRICPAIMLEKIK